MPADRPPRGRRHTARPFDERAGRLERMWGLVLRRFRAAAEAADNPDEERDDHT